MSYDFNFTESGYVPGAPFNFNFAPPFEKYYILKGITNNFIAIWADPQASLTNNKMYVSSAAAFSVVDLENKDIDDYYTQSHVGRANEALEHEDIIDLNI